MNGISNYILAVLLQYDPREITLESDANYNLYEIFDIRNKYSRRAYQRPLVISGLLKNVTP